jgi:hypothetical protein
MDENPTLQNAVKLMEGPAALGRVLDNDGDAEAYMAAVDDYSKALAEVDLLTYVSYCH